MKVCVTPVVWYCLNFGLEWAPWGGQNVWEGSTCAIEMTFSEVPGGAKQLPGQMQPTLPMVQQAIDAARAA